MSEREPISKRLRFEVLKRDGFRCKYCGANAAQSLLHVDHVVAVAEGGTDDPVNLVAACATCNLGKSSKSLEESALDAPSPTEAMREHAEQMRAYLEAVRERELARADLDQFAIDHWCDTVDADGMPVTLIKSLGYWIEQIGLERVIDCIDAVARKSARQRMYPASQRKYFLACARNTRDEATS